MKYEERNKILSLKRLNYSKRDGSRICIQLRPGVTNCMPCQTAVQKEEILFFLSTIIKSVTYRNIFWSRPKAFNLRFCPVYISVTLNPSVLEWASHKRKVLSQIIGGLYLVS